MQKTVLAWFICGIAVLSVKAQDAGDFPLPGTWIVSTLDANKNAAITEIVGETILFASSMESSAGTVNFHPVLSLPGHLALSMPLKASPERTIAAVYGTPSHAEQVVWSVSSEDTLQTILTTHRAAHLPDYRFMHFSEIMTGRPVLSTYVQNLRSVNTTGFDTLSIGNQPEKQIPVNHFMGYIPEMLIFDRMLSPEDRLKVESFLAIKYGLTLAPDDGVRYLNARGDLIWDSQQSPDYIHRITGIGRDDASGLYQKQSTCSLRPGLLTIAAGEIKTRNAANTSEFPDQSFLIWGDNGKSMASGPAIAGSPEIIKRTWLMQASGQGSTIPTSVRFNRADVLIKTDPDEHFWLIIDRSGTGTFAAGSTEYFAMHASGPAITCDSISWDTDGNGRDIFTLAKGKHFIAPAWITPPACHSAETGMITVIAQGGRPPYYYRLYGEQHVLDAHRKAGEPVSFEGLLPGKYVLQASDRDGQVSSDTLFLSHLDGPAIDLEPVHILDGTGSVRFDLSREVLAQNLTIQWKQDNAVLANGPLFMATQPGAYILTANRNGCMTHIGFEVRQAVHPDFTVQRLFPNPSTDGKFVLWTELNKQTELDIMITDMHGRVLSNTILPADDLHVFRGSIPDIPGSYVITSRIPGKRQSTTLIIQ